MPKSKGGKRSKKFGVEKSGDLPTPEPESLEDATHPATKSYPDDVLAAVEPESIPESVENMEPDPPASASKPDPTPESPPEPPLPRIHLRVFEKVSGMKWDQFAGFRAYAKSNNLGPMTIPAWREAVQAYKNKPMS